MNILSRCKGNAAQFYTNLRGWKTRRKLLVIESDDWGAIRMPSRTAYRALQRAGIPVDQFAFDRLDCLERRFDIEALLSVLSAHRDMNSSAPKFTANMVMGNPDFEAIRRDDYRRYHHEPFLHSYQRVYGENCWGLWKEGIDGLIFDPQFHARSHLNPELWLSDLRSGHQQALFSFENEFYGLTTRTGQPGRQNYLAAYWPATEDDMANVNREFHDGVSEFKAVFGKRPDSFVACNYVWPDELEREVLSRGIRVIQGQRGQLKVSRVGKKMGRRSLHTGLKNLNVQTYVVRNVFFEPFLDPSKDWVSKCLREIRNAFILGTPAVISSHRANYVSEMKYSNRDRNLRQLNELLYQVKKLWPEVEFSTSKDIVVSD